MGKDGTFVRCAQKPSVAIPRTAAKNVNGKAGAGITRPLPDIAIGIVKAKGIGGEQAHRMGLIPRIAPKPGMRGQILLTVSKRVMGVGSPLWRQIPTLYLRASCRCIRLEIGLSAARIAELLPRIRFPPEG